MLASETHMAAARVTTTTVQPMTELNQHDEKSAGNIHEASKYTGDFHYVEAQKLEGPQNFDELVKAMTECTLLLFVR